MERYYLKKHKNPDDKGHETSQEAFLAAAQKAGITGRVPERFSGPCGESRVTGWVEKEADVIPVAGVDIRELVT